MSGSPPKTPPYPERALHPYPVFANQPQNPYPNFPPNTYHPPPLLSYPVTTCDPEDRIPPPPGFIYQPSFDPHSLTYAPQELSSPDIVSDTDQDKEKICGSAIGKKSNLGNYKWVGASCSNCTLTGALLVGHDTDGSELYAGRAYHLGDMIPAKVIPSKQVAYISYGGQEVVKDQFEVLCQPTVSWNFCSGGQIPDGAVEVGNTADGEVLYFGRVNHGGTMTPGKVQRSHGCCYYPFDGQEMSAADYEVLYCCAPRLNVNFGFQPPPINVNLTPGRPNTHHHHHHQPPTIAICPTAPSHVTVPVSYPPNPQPTSSSDGYSWIPTTAHSCYTLEHKAVVAGYDYDRSPIYIGRAHHNGDLIPCKVIPKHKIAYFAYDSREISTTNFELYCQNMPRIEWVPSTNGQIPPGAVPAGRTANGETLYAGRAHHQGVLTIGKVQPSHGSCYISHGGQELCFKVYEVMVHVYN
ncbi:uncharacterized protein LOC143910754 [Arctopsyche grandis]|uniref:uncharacterized protein LOC143910754 n=1 Tax=Arctopsyche grandis TaxID=121162 RepID=UPI00406D82FA